MEKQNGKSNKLKDKVNLYIDLITNQPLRGKPIIEVASK